MANPVRWLHLSDLHFGCRGTEQWWQVKEDFERSVREMVTRLGPPDLVLISGDLTHRGCTPEFETANRFLDALLAWLGEDGGKEPLIVPVPGNHDLIRPQGMAALPYRVLDGYGQGGGNADVRMLDEELWERRDAAFVEPLFKDYLTWLGQRIVPQLERRGVAVHRSHFAGDLCLELEIPGTFPLCIVGLNSAWQQYRDGNFEGKLQLPAEQFHAALPAADDSPLEVFRRCQRALLIMHHPPGWLSKRGRAIFDESIYTPRRFDLCLHGHMHEGRSESVAISGGSVRTTFQAPSLFGLEHYGSAKERRSMGYAWGTIRAEGEVRVWPLTWHPRGDGTHAFVHDHAFPEEAQGTLIRPAAERQAPPVPEKPRADQFRAYLEDLVDRTDHISISGIAAGSAKGALRHPIERLYTPLRSRAEPLRELAAAPGDGARLTGDGLVELAEVLPRFPRLLIEGQPGAGKTTFLRFAACMLARDALGRECPEGPSWSRRYLGLPARDRPWVPVLIRIADLVMVLEAPGAPPLRRDGCQCLLDLLASWCAVNAHPVSQEEWRGLFDDGEAILLLDGLDEVADERMRDRVFEIFRDACRRFKSCPLVVASRPTQTAALGEMEFHTVIIEPFGDAEIRTFVDHWVAALHEQASAADLGGEGQRYRERLQAAIIEQPRVRRLATNPVMLTCLCVVHWNEGRLPEGRSRVYRAVVRWLIAARTDLRKEAGFSDRFALRAFARLALEMMNAKKGKRSIFDLQEGAVAVDAVVRRDWPALEDEDRCHRAREWLRFECLGSGIVEEVAGNRIRFWHLTFQEFLAALQLAWRGDGEDRENDWWPLVRERLDDAQWRETIELFPGCLLDEGGEGRVDKFLDRVLEIRGPDPDLAAEARIAGIVGRLLQPLSVYDYRSQPEIAAAYDEALKRSLAIFTLAGAAAVPVKDRIAAAEALGRGGDPRLAPERDNFIEVPGCDGLRLGKYQVTVEEYQRFVEQRGYEDEKHWDAEGWTLRSEEGWEEPGIWEEQLGTPNRPAVRVSWYEAVAYCRWLSEQRGESIRLPTGEEWEKAATPEQGKYPWGEEEPDPERANFWSDSKSTVGAPTPVGIYPAGDGRFGHCDLAGNVWEWCSDEIRVKGDDEVRREVRGGGWDYPAEGLRAAYRSGGRPRYRYSNLGFRVAVAPASP